MMDIHLNKGINKNTLVLLCSRYCGIDDKRIIITTKIDQIKNIKDREKSVWLNITERKYGDFKTTLAIFEDKKKFGSFYNFALLIAKETKQIVLSDFNRNLNNSEWILLDKAGNEITVEENNAVIYPEGEDGITLAERFKYLFDDLD